MEAGCKSTEELAMQTVGSVVRGDEGEENSGSGVLERDEAILLVGDDPGDKGDLVGGGCLPLKKAGSWGTVTRRAGIGLLQPSPGQSLSWAVIPE